MGGRGRAGSVASRPQAGSARDVLPGQIGGRSGHRARRSRGNGQVPRVLRPPGAQAGLGRTGASTVTGMAGCREIRQALGVYVLGAIDPAERAMVDEHLSSCQECREELASLAGLPAMLRKVPIVEAERLAAPERDPELAGVPSAEMLTSLIARTTNVRRMHRWRTVAAAAAVAIVALGGGAFVANALQSPSAQGSGQSHMAWHQTSGTGSVTGAHLTVRYRNQPWGTQMEVNVTGLQPGSVCQFQVTDATGGKSVVGSWTAWSGTYWYPASTWLGEQELRSFQVTIDGKVVATAPVE